MFVRVLNAFVAQELLICLLLLSLLVSYLVNKLTCALPPGFGFNPFRKRLLLIVFHVCSFSERERTL